MVLAAPNLHPWTTNTPLVVVLIWRLCQVKDSTKKTSRTNQNLEDWRNHKKITLRHPHPQNTQKNKQQQKNWKSRRKTSNGFFLASIGCTTEINPGMDKPTVQVPRSLPNRPPSLELRTSVSKCQPVEHFGSVFKTIQATCWMVGNWWKQITWLTGRTTCFLKNNDWKGYFPFEMAPS